MAYIHAESRALGRWAKSIGHVTKGHVQGGVNCY